MKKLFVILLVMLIALSACQTATPTESAAPTQAAAAGEATAAPAAEATAAQPAEPAPAAGPKELTVGLGQESYPTRGWAIDSDDGFSMAYIGILETLVKVDFDG